jgi:hypothetical protein
MNLSDEALNAWGTQFMTLIDKELTDAGMLSAEVPEAMEFIAQKHPDLTEQQLEWIDIWLSELSE